MIILISNLRRTANRRPPVECDSVAKGVAAAVIATIVTVPAHGFIVNSGVLMHSTAEHPYISSPAMGWMQTFLAACAWAFMIAAGSLVYNHFVGKWQEKGYPILPVAALAASDNISQLRGKQAIPLNGSTTNSSHKYDTERDSQPYHVDWMDQYEG